MNEIANRVMNDTMRRLETMDEIWSLKKMSGQVFVGIELEDDYVVVSLKQSRREMFHRWEIHGKKLFMKI